jgi:polysaccharide biosynthesis/export protein
MTLRSDRFVTAMLAIAIFGTLMLPVGAGCSNNVYRASKLPIEFIAPSSPNMETINLANLANRSVSREVIQPGDVLDVAMVTDYTKLTSTTTPIRVGDNGAVIVPLIGAVVVSGLSAEQAEQVIASESINRGVFRTPCVAVTMKQCRMNKVTVVGAVAEPGIHDLPRGSSSLLAALVAAGGLSKEASTEVEIRRTDQREFPPGGPMDRPSRVAESLGPDGRLISYDSPNQGTAVIPVNLTAATSGAQQVPELRDGDVVYVAKRVLPAIYVLGLVTKPGEFPFPANQELRVLDSLAMAGGVSNPVAEKVLVLRHLPNRKEPIQIAVSIQSAKNGQDNIALAPGDTVSVEQTPETAVVDVLKSFIHFSIGSTVPMF